MTRAYVTIVLALLSLLAACSQPTTPERVPPIVAGFTAEHSTITEGGSTTLSWEAVSAGATLTLTPDIGDVTGKSSVTVSPTETTEYTLTASNEAGSNQYKVTVTVQPKEGPVPTNRTPVSESVVKSTREGTAVTVQLVGSDPDGDPLRYSIVGEPQNGSLSGLNPDTGEVIYTPNSNFSGTDSFTFTVSDGERSSAVATVTINVTKVNDPPVAKPQTHSTPEDTAVVITLTAEDADGDTLTYGIVTQPKNGSLSGLNTSTGKVTYTPNKNYNGKDSFSFQANDGTDDSDVETVSITVTAVNDAPVIANGDSVTVTMSEDSSPTAFALTLNASDVENDTLSWTISRTAEHGTASVSGTGFSKAVSYSPEVNYTGTDTFVVKVADGDGGEDTITVNVTITPVNPAFSSTLVVQHSGKCLDSPRGRGSRERDADLIQYDCHGEANQRFTFHEVVGKADTYFLKSEASGLCADVSSSQKAGDDFVVHQRSCGAQSNQQFTLQATGAAKVFSLVSNHSGKCVSVLNASLSNRAAVVVQSCNGAENQLWEIPNYKADTATPSR